MMFLWIREKLARRNRAKQIEKQFSPPSGRQIFCFHDGDNDRAIDPMMAFRALHTDPEFRIDVHPQLVDEGDLEAIDIILRAIERSFGVHRWDEGTKTGMTQWEMLQLYADFCDYIDTLKKNTSRLPTSPDSTGQTSSKSSRTTTKNTARSGSNGNAKKSAKPTG